MSTAPAKKQPIPFGKYLLLDRINIGGMAEVWRAKTFGAGGFERLVAIKRILPNIAEDKEFIEMFIDEAKITVQLGHANIAQIHELSQIGGSYYIAMEYVSGKDMRAVFDRCRKRGEPAPIPLTCYVIAQACEGLDYAHRAKDKQGRNMSIVHRDVSPQNVLFSYEGEVKVIDFGIAKAAGKVNKTQAGILKGKFGYMSPEQIRGLPLDQRSDVFAAGVCLYEMLTGERLFVGDSDFSVLEKVRKVEVLPPSHFNRRIPEALEKIVMKTLAKDVEERYQYCSEVAEDLRTFMYSTGNPFARKDLAAFMNATFAEEVDKEKARRAEYAEIKAPEGMMAAAELGFGVGVIPAAPGSTTNASNVTAVPTMVPPTVGPSSMNLQQVGGRPGTGVRPGPPVAPPTRSGESTLPPMVRSVPPTRLAPVSMPRLSAAPPKPSGPHREEATVMADGQDAFGDGNMNNRLGTGEVPTDPSLQRLPPSAGPVPYDPEPLAATDHDAANPYSSAPVLRSVAKSNPSNPSNPRYPMDDASNPSASSYQVNQPRRSGLMMGLIIGLILVAGGVAGFALWPRAAGLVLLDLPPEIAKTVRVSINGDPVVITEVPFVTKVKPGPATIVINAPGYEPLIETVTVREGNELTQLTKQLKKKGSPPGEAP